VLDAAPVPVVEAEEADPVIEEAYLAAEERARLEELLDELQGLKARLRGAKALKAEI
jgi:hypothetical protein